MRGIAIWVTRVISNTIARITRMVAIIAHAAFKNAPRPVKSQPRGLHPSFFEPPELDPRGLVLKPLVLPVEKEGATEPLRNLILPIMLGYLRINLSKAVNPRASPVAKEARIRSSETRWVSS